MNTLIVERQGGVLWLRLNRPQARNGIDATMRDELSLTLADADLDRDVRAIVVAAAGPDFCVGADLAASAGQEPENPLDYRRPMLPYQDLFRQLWQLETPVVSAVRGRVAGIGWMLALLADLVVASDTAKWTHVFTRRGMAPHAGDPFFLPRILPFHVLNEIALLGDTITSGDLHRWGAVNRLVADAVVDATAGELAARLAAGPTLSLGQARRLYRRSLVSDMTTAFAEEAAAIAMLSATSDRAEGTAALLEGRRPNFKGRLSERWRGASLASSFPAPAASRRGAATLEPPFTPLDSSSRRRAGRTGEGEVAPMARARQDAAGPDGGGDGTAPSPREIRRQQRVELSREQLLDTAEQLFSERGYHATGLKEVAERCEFSVGSIYQFFDSKDTLYQEVLLRRGYPMRDEMARIAAGEGSAAEQLLALAKLQIEHFREYPAWGRLTTRVLTPGARPPTDLPEAFLAAWKEAIDLEARLIERGQRDGQLRDGNPRALARLFSGMVSSFHAIDEEVSDAPEEFSAGEFLTLIAQAFAVGGSVKSQSRRRR